MIKEILSKSIRTFVPDTPSSELEDFVESIRMGRNMEVPAYGIGSYGTFDYYGKDQKGDEKARFIIPWGDGYSERSYHISRTQQGKVIVIDEGFFPSSL